MATSTLSYGNWLIEVDPEATRQGYAAVAAEWASRGKATSCDCSPCRNFAKQRRAVIPPEVLALMARIGIDPDHDLESVDYGPDGEVPGLRYGQVWYPFVGRVVHDAPEGTSGWKVNPGEDSSQWAICFEVEPPIRPIPSFQGALAQLDVDLLIPWRLTEEPEPR